ncbi:MAG: hypothetical protein KC421_08640 [Anaerolineales bacterium]|nr:hypothetical protein [Anaerolineales bacterium]
MALASIKLPQETLNDLGQMANSVGANPSELADKAIRQYLRREAEKKIAREEAVFQTQHGELLERYNSQFIAMHQGQVVDHDQDELALYLRIRKQYPSIGILIKQVTSEPEIVWHVHSPRMEND